MSGYSSKSLCLKGHELSHYVRKFQGELGRPPTTFGVRKLESLVWCCLRDLTLNRFDTIPACGRQTDRQTDRQTHYDG